MMIKYKSIILVIFIFCSVNTLDLQYLDQQIYTKISTQMNNTHYYVIHKTLLTKDMIKHLDHYEYETNVKIYQCDFQQDTSICPKEKPLRLFINSIQLEFNGRLDHDDDIKKWIQYRINEHPNRLTSLEQLQQYTRQKFQVFCFVDNSQEEVEMKEFIFVALAKKWHFLYFCLIDEALVKPIDLKSGHLALIRRNMTKQTDQKSQQMAHNDVELLFNTWQEFVTNIFISDMRLGHQNPKADEVIIQCDMSLQCEEDMSFLFITQKIWRTFHPEVSFTMRIHPEKSGAILQDDLQIHYFPIYKYTKKELKERFEENEGKVRKFIDITKSTYIYEDPDIREDTITKLIQKVKNNELKVIKTQTQTIEEQVKGLQIVVPQLPSATEQRVQQTQQL